MAEGQHLGQASFRSAAGEAGHSVPPVASEFDQYAHDYVSIIDRDTVRVTGESFEFFVAMRLGLVAQELARIGGTTPRAILDFGCGIGVTEKLLRDRYPEAKIAGIDSSHESLQAARCLGLRDVEFHLSSTIDLPFSDRSFDLIYSNGTFHHIARDQHLPIVRELCRVLRPGGHLFVFENNPLNPVTVLVMRRNPFDRSAKMLFPWYLRRLQQQAGLTAEAARFYVFFPKQLKALRSSENYLRFVPLGAQYYVWGSKPPERTGGAQPSGESNRDRR